MSTAGPAAADVRVEIDEVSHTYPGGTVALDDVSLSIGAGLFGLLGPNGAGKSTLMRIVCTLLRPTRGEVRVANHDVVGEPREVRRLIGYLPQEFGAWRLARVREVLDTLGRLSGLRDRRQRAERIERTLDLVGLAAKANDKVKSLSGGMVRRLGVAQALLHEPPVLVVDEPTVGLDPEERLRFRELMAKLARDRVILLSTHIVADLGSGCRRIALLDHGKIAFEGSPEDLVARARGKVFEVTVPAGRPVQLGAGAEEVSRTSSGGRVTIRGVASGALPEGARPVDAPTLEEAYLAFMLARGRTLDEVGGEEER
ncbi:MAG: ATP-binding cassette domain-containing protein [Acidobacteria bacterium]|nr:MAG: ATP-binding cassette domain-containing protein [Acidobacteriota bacterium]